MRPLRRIHRAIPMRLLSGLALMALIAPGASAGVPFETDIDDPSGDVSSMGHGRIAYPSADILRARSQLVENGTLVLQRIEMAARPVAPDDTILVRSWFHDSGNGTFFAVDMPVEGSAHDPAARFKPVIRRGTFDNATPIEARFGLDNATWVFTFQASLVEDATCFTLDVTTVHTPKRAMQGFDALGRNGSCVTGVEPIPDMPPSVDVSLRDDARAPTPPSVEPPGSQATPLPVPLLFAALLGLAFLRRRA